MRGDPDSNIKDEKKKIHDKWRLCSELSRAQQLKSFAQYSCFNTSKKQWLSCDSRSIDITALFYKSICHVQQAIHSPSILRQTQLLFFGEKKGPHTKHTRFLTSLTFAGKMAMNYDGASKWINDGTANSPLVTRDWWATRHIFLAYTTALFCVKSLCANLHQAYQFLFGHRVRTRERASE